MPTKLTTKQQKEIRQQSRANVANGAALLDDKVPDWWVKLDLGSLDLGSLELGSCENCVVGQLAREMGRDTFKFTRDVLTERGAIWQGVFPERFGFDAPRLADELDDGNDEVLKVAFGMLDDFWTEVVKERWANA